MEVACCSGNFDVGFDLGYGCAEGGHAVEGAVRVGSGGEVGEAGGSFGEAGEEGVAVGDGFVSGEDEGARERAGGADEFGGHWIKGYGIRARLSWGWGVQRGESLLLLIGVVGTMDTAGFGLWGSAKLTSAAEAAFCRMATTARLKPSP